MALSRTLSLALGLVIVGSLGASAQEATVVGSTIDESKALIPGVTITATDLATGRQFVDVSTDRGEYRLVGLPAGQYKVQAELVGFAPTIIPQVELLVGQNATITFTLKLANVSEDVTVTGESPLVDTRQAQVAGNVDRRQMEELPIQGRNWLQLSMMVKGITANTVTNNPGVDRVSAFQLNLDGQEITQGTSVGGFGQPGISRDAIAEYQIVTNLFDVTMGRSDGIQVQAISRTGTNSLSGSAYGYFRDDKLNSPDFFTDRVLPYQNQQLGGTLGGPIIRDRMHFFGSYEYEREPNDAVLTTTSTPGQVLTLPTNRIVKTFLGRVDYQLTNADHLLVRGNYFNRFVPRTTTANVHPGRGAQQDTTSHFAIGNWSRVISSSLLQEVKFGYYKYYWTFAPAENVPTVPEYIFPGLTIGPQWNYPEHIRNARVTARYDLMWHKGKHDLKVGGEWLPGLDSGWWPARERGQMFFSALPADAGRRFPLDAWSDFSRWDFSGLDSTVLRFVQSYSRDWNYRVPRPTYAVWIGDTWTVNNHLTLNLGLRYDLPWGDLAPPYIQETDWIIDNGLFSENVGLRGDIRDTNNVAPRAGFTWKVTEASDLIVRGGTGLFYTTAGTNQAFDMQQFNGQRVIVNTYENDGRPGFLSDPTRGVTADDIIDGRVPRQPQSPSVIAHDFQMPYTWQSMLGFQKQLNDVMAFDADLVYQRGYNKDSQRDPNLFYNPVTEFNRHPTQSGRPNPSFGPISLKESHGRSDYMALATSLTRRYRNNFQLGLTYTLMFFKNDTGTGESGYSAQQINPFDIDLEWGRAGDFQRHTFRTNGIWKLPYGVTLAGFFQYGSGQYSTVTTGVNPLGTNTSRIRSDLSVVSRNTFHNDPVQALDLRVSKEIRLRGNIRLEGIAEIFNLYNYERFQYNTLETSPNFGLPQSTATGAQPRAGQLAFRVSF